MSFYLDTSAIIAALTDEAKGSDVRFWLAQQNIGTLVSSLWVGTEVASALAQKVRMAHYSADEIARITTAWRTLVDQNLLMEDVSARHFELASIFVSNSKLGLRAGDALHLAIASDRGHRVATLDKVMADAGAKLGIVTLLL